MAFCRQREGTVLSASLSTSAILISLNSFADITSIYHSYRSPTATVFYTAETLQDELLTIKHYCVRRSPQYAALVQCSQASGDEACDDGRREEVLRTTSASSFEHRRSSLYIPLRLFTRGFRTLPSTKPPKLTAF